MCLELKKTRIKIQSKRSLHIIFNELIVGQCGPL